MASKSLKNFDIKTSTMYKIGGQIKEVFYPETLDEFVEILKNNPNIKVFGNLSNTLVSTFGSEESIVVTTNMKDIKIEGTKVVALCGVKGPKLAQEVAKQGLSGFEFMIGFPGSIGGEVYMNASAHNQAISDKLVTVTCFSPKFGVKKFTKEEMGFDYRTSRCAKDNLVVLQAEFELEKKSVDEVEEQMKKNLVFRKLKQPLLNEPNCGSVFKNPVGDSAGRLLESIGAKQMSIGGVKVWENHANFIVNTNNGTSLHVLELMYKMQTKVKEVYNIELEPEIRFLGGKNQRENELCKILYKK